MDVLVIGDPHAHPDFSNHRADYLGKYILDARPDVVVNLGDTADMASLSSYDRGKRSFVGRSYRADINSHLDFQERMWHPLRHAKKKLPKSFVFEGNHEHRVEKALDLSPELEGTLGFEDFEFDAHYDEVIRYRGGTPGVKQIEGVNFAHYVVSGHLGRPVGGIHSAYSLITTQLASTVVGHSHISDYCTRVSANGLTIQGLVAGCYFDYEQEWAGEQVNKLYWRGLVLLKNVNSGSFDPEFISMNRLKQVYGDGR